MKRLQVRLARLQCAQKLLDSEKASKRSDRKAYWKHIAKQAMRAAACGDTRKLYRMLKSFSRRPADVGEVLLKYDGSVIPDQAERLCMYLMTGKGQITPKIPFLGENKIKRKSYG